MRGFAARKLLYGGAVTLLARQFSLGLRSQARPAALLLPAVLLAQFENCYIASGTLGEVHWHEVMEAVAARPRVVAFLSTATRQQVNVA